jgi:16S rRNA (guanine1207-N2)-methyltransferase
VELVDSNLLAVAAARRNLADLGLAQAHAYPGDALSETRDANFSLIASNPPFHTGKMVDYHAAEAFIRQGRQALAPSGRMVIVANRFIRYDGLMAELFSTVETLVVTSRFHVLCGRV